MASLGSGYVMRTLLSLVEQVPSYNRSRGSGYSPSNMYKDGQSGKPVNQRKS